MASYDVHVQDSRGVRRNFRAHIEAASPSEAVALARRSLPDLPGQQVYAVYRRRRLRGRRLVGLYPGEGGDDGLAGVREPRRPRPTPPSLHASADLPAYPEQ